MDSHIVAHAEMVILQAIVRLEKDTIWVKAPDTETKGFQ
jgi:hypothetical protein